MQVRFRGNSLSALAAKEAFYVSPSQLFLSSEKTYTVHAVSVYNGIAFAQVVDDMETPVFLPRAIFEVVDTTIPADWICNLFADGSVQLVMGPPHVAKDVASYNAMVDQELAQVEQFWSRNERAHED